MLGVASLFSNLPARVLRLSTLTQNYAPRRVEIPFLPPCMRLWAILALLLRGCVSKILQLCFGETHSTH
jgi:hypothetical protein